MAEKMYDFRKRLLTVHDSDVRNPKRKTKDNEFEITNGALIKISPKACDVVKIAANDFVDFLNVSMGVTAGVVNFGDDAIITLELAEDAGVDLGEFASYKGFFVQTSAQGIKIYGHDPRGIAQALFYIEDLMCFAKAPVLAFGDIKKKPMFYPQMVHSGYGIDEFPDEYLLRVAHEGRDAILVFTKDLNKTTCGYLNFNELIDRAAKYGIDVYAYSYLKSEVSPEAPEAEEYYEGNYGKLFRE
ncbi:MAG: hypothetical protein E7403_08165, partial [Ruminococcaceae bacterium]|nr:hypothetical protein [Oscillospiraceae bacterium]